MGEVYASPRTPRLIEKAARKDIMTPSERGGEVGGILVMLLVTAFFAYHQVAGTGFFTPRFGPLEMTLLYGGGVMGVLTSVTRAAIGRRNALRPLEMAGMVLWIAASLWFLTIFPFNFSHLADALPGSLHFLLSWISDDIAKALLVIGSVGGVIGIIYDGILYASVRRWLLGGVHEHIH